MKIFILSLFLLAGNVFSLAAQQRIDLSMVVEGDERRYSIYLPAGYTADKVYPLVFSPQPAKVGAGVDGYDNNWTATRWCDSLATLGKNNNAIVLCPDGGADDRVQPGVDPVDTVFMGRLLDSAFYWYSIDTQRVYMLAYRLTVQQIYEFGVKRSGIFNGYIDLCLSTMLLAGPFKDSIHLVDNKPFHIVRAQESGWQVGVSRLVDTLRAYGAIVDTVWIPKTEGEFPGFPEFQPIMQRAFDFVDSVSRAQAAVSVADTYDQRGTPVVYPHPAASGAHVTLRLHDIAPLAIDLMDVAGMRVAGYSVPSTGGEPAVTIALPSVSPGVYFLRITQRGRVETVPVVIR